MDDDDDVDDDDDDDDDSSDFGGDDAFVADALSTRLRDTPGIGCPLSHQSPSGGQCLGHTLSPRLPHLEPTAALISRATISSLAHTSLEMAPQPRCALRHPS